MEAKVIKISFENYRWLSRIAGIIQKEKEKPISLDEALTSLKFKKEKNDFLSYAGIWKDRNEEEILISIKKGWGYG